MKVHKKIKIGVLKKKQNIFCSNFQSLMNLKMKFWGYTEKNMGLHLTFRKVLVPVEPWWMRV